MATVEEGDHHTAEQLPAQEASEEQQYKSPERRHVEDLLDISDEAFLAELEPYEYHCYSGWEEAVRGWARVAPMCGVFLPQKKCRKPEHKEAGNVTPVSADRTVANADSSASIAEHRCHSRVGPRYSFKKTKPLNQLTGSWRNTAVADLQEGASEWPVKEKIEDGTLRETPFQPHHFFSKYSVMENIPTKPQKHSHRPKSTMVPIKNFTFLPPINSPQLNPQKVSSQNAP